MNMRVRGLAHPKPIKRSTVTRRKAKAERAVKQHVRTKCLKRDGPLCRLGDWELNPEDWHSDSIGDGEVCDGATEWAHMHAKRRSQTRGMPPEVRHDTAHSLMLCKRIIWPMTDTN